MPWHIQVLQTPLIVETIYSGVLTPAELSEAVRETLALARPGAVNRFLGNCESLVGGHSIVDLYFLADAVMATGLAHTMKEALVIPEGAAPADKVEFWETACASRGINVRVFHNRQSAIDWLRQ
jgi:hypothetical protein